MMKGGTMTDALRNISFSAPDQVYVANADASSFIQRWRKSDGWLLFSRCFSSTYVTNNKPHGIYIIPIFSGSNERGHWTFIVVEKAKKQCRAWLLDSLGRGDTNSDICKNVKIAFSRAKLRCRWMATRCFPQTEAECGSRVIMGIVKLCNQIRQGKTIEQALEAVQAWVPGGSCSYDSLEVRRSAAEWLNPIQEEVESRERRTRVLRRFWRSKLNSEVDSAACNSGNTID